MKEKSGSLTAADFFEKLQHDKLDTTVPFSIIGMVKKSEGKEKIIEFAPGGNCSNWVTIPLELIEDVEVMKTISCKDHSHPLVNLNMKTPKTPEGKIFFALLKGMKHGKEYMQHQHDLPESDFLNPSTEDSIPTSMARLSGGRFGGFGGRFNRLNFCLSTWVDKWVCRTTGNTTICGWEGSWECIPQ